MNAIIGNYEPINWKEEWPSVIIVSILFIILAIIWQIIYDYLNQINPILSELFLIITCFIAVASSTMIISASKGE